jgi:PIN domain
MIDVVLDANVLAADFGLTSGPMQWLLEQGRERELRIVVPKVALIEAVAGYRRQADEARLQLQRALRQFRRLGSDLDELVPRPLDDDVANYEVALSDALRGARALIAEPPNVGHDEIARRAASRIKPFNERGSGYRDTLIWMTVLERAAQADEVVFVSANVKDFAEPGEPDQALHSSLRSELIEAGVDERVSFFTDLAGFVRARTAPAHRAREALEALAAEGQLLAIIDNRIVDLAAGVTLRDDEIALLGGVVDVDRVTVVSVGINDVEVGDARTLDEERVIVQLVIDADIEVEYFITKADAYGIESDPDLQVLDWDWNERYIRAGTVRRAVLNIEGIYDLGAEDFEDLALDAIDATAEDR